MYLKYRILVKLLCELISLKPGVTYFLISVIVLNNIYAKCDLCWVSLMLSVIYANCHLCWVSLMLSVTYAECHLCWVSLMLSITYAECHLCWVSHTSLYAECRYAKCCYAGCRSAKNRTRLLCLAYPLIKSQYDTVACTINILL